MTASREFYEHDGQQYPAFRIEDNQKYEPLPSFRHFTLSTTEQTLIDEYTLRGLQAIARNELCVLTLCGGQASRLGAAIPKGTYSLSLGGRFDTLLRLQAAQIQRLRQLVKCRFPGSQAQIRWLLMVSRTTRGPIEQHLVDICKDFNISLDTIQVFEQNEVPCFYKDGRVIHKSPQEVQTAPNGNGDIYACIQPLLASLEQDGIRYFHVYCVDNILCRVGDPTFVGFAVTKGADCAAKVVQKQQPTERVGVLALRDGKPTVIEYSELTEEMAQQRDSDCKLVYGAGSIANHFFTLDFVKRAANTPLLYHCASKKVAYYDAATQELVTPTEPNGVKLEKFIFDVFPISNEFYAYEVDAAEEFSPLKNDDAVGTDCPSTCRRDLARAHARWLERANVEFTAPLYIAPTLSYAGEGLNDKLIKQKAIAAPLNGWLE